MVDLRRRLSECRDPQSVTRETWDSRTGPRRVLYDLGVSSTTSAGSTSKGKVGFVGMKKTESTRYRILLKVLWLKAKGPKFQRY